MKRHILISAVVVKGMHQNKFTGDLVLFALPVVDRVKSGGYQKREQTAGSMHNGCLTCATE